MLKALLQRWQRSRPARALARYNNVNGPLLTGGIAFSALFSIVAALTVAFSIFSAVLGSHAELQKAVLDTLDGALPGIVKTADNPHGLLSPTSLQFSANGSIAVAVVSFLILVNSAAGVMSSLATAIRAMFGVTTPPVNAVVLKLRDVAAFGVLALAVLVTAALGIVVSSAGTALADAVGIGASPATVVVLRILGHGVAFVIDTAVVIYLVRALAAVRPPRRDLLLAAILVAVAAAVIRYLGISVVGGSVTKSALLAPFAAIAVLLLWVNLIVRVLLMVCAWAANPPAVAAVPADHLTWTRKTPNYVTESAPATLDWEHDPATGKVAPQPPPPPPPYWGGLIGRIRRGWRAARQD